MAHPYAPVLDELLEARVVTRIWQRDISVWGAAEASPDAQSIRSRLGWLDVGETMPDKLPRLHDLATRAKDERIDAAYLLGMGGSSLCAEVIRSVFGLGSGYPEIYVLDTTDERTILSASARLEPARTLFLVASKSGGTVEVASLEQHFWSHLAGGQPDAGRQFVAITDPGTALQGLAESKRYREVFLNPANIGGRFSALSLFGLAPSALIGTDPQKLLTGGVTMADGCRQENHTNAGLELGAFIGAAARNGRDKLTCVLPPSLASLGLWIEQLVAESTGKHGKGALPVVDEPLGRPDQYGDDRAFVSIATDRDEPDAGMLRALADAGHPVLHLTTRLDGLGAEFFRWEFATAVAGAVLGINPFDEPNVAEAKEKTKALLSAFESTGALPETAAAAGSTTIDAYAPTFTGSSPAAVVRSALASLKAGDYVAFLSYLTPTDDVQEMFTEIRLGIRSTFKVASTYGVGPRYLHSTGQYHKGGPNTVLAFVITGDDETETTIPGANYSFAILKRAQALGDAETLAAHGRRIVRLHLKGEASPGEIEALFAEALR